MSPFGKLMCGINLESDLVVRSKLSPSIEFRVMHISNIFLDISDEQDTLISISLLNVSCPLTKLPTRSALSIPLLFNIKI
jgi:hypothetical protein